MNNNKKNAALRLATAVVAVAAAQVASAIPIGITGLAVFRADRTANPIGFSTTALNVQVQVSPSTSTSTQVFVSNSVDGFTTQYQINRVAAGIFAGQHIGEIAYNPALTGLWRATANNGGDVAAPAFRSAFLPVDAMPYVQNISFSGTGNNITIQWDVGAAGLARLDRQSLSIWDITNPLNPFTVQFADLGVADRNVALTNLAIGRTYAAEILNTDRRNLADGSLGAVDAFSGTWLSGWITTQGEVRVPISVPEPATGLLILGGLAALGFARRKRA